VGVVLLKRLADAERDGDTIVGVLRGSAANHDGASNGITSPSRRAQTELLLKAWADARLECAAQQLSYVEAHGTGTAQGDPIEVDALNDALRHSLQQHASRRADGADATLWLGSLKSNIGHCADGAAGVLGLIKVLMCMQHRSIPASLHCNPLNNGVDWSRSLARVCDTRTSWQGSGDSPLLAGVSAFGLLGTNVHVVVESAPHVSQPVAVAVAALDARRPLHQTLVLGAMTRTSLLQFIARLADHIDVIQRRTTTNDSQVRCRQLH
jgi:acyl transferase domain-containing protein